MLHLSLSGLNSQKPRNPTSQKRLLLQADPAGYGKKTVAVLVPVRWPHHFFAFRLSVQSLLFPVALRDAAPKSMFNQTTKGNAMSTRHTNQQAGQNIKTDAHPKACVESQTTPDYNVEREENIIRDALNILARRMRRERAFFNSPSAVRNYLKLKMAELEFEAFNVIFLDAQHGVIASEEMFRGTLTQTSVYPREVVKRALFHNAAAVVFAHNHPSGKCEPSQSDRLLTDALKQSLALVDVRALDHFIIAGMDCLSFAERGLI